MMMIRLLLVALLLGNNLVLEQAQAEAVRYISDELEVPLRAGTSTRFKILQMLSSGTSLTVINSDPGSGYSKVRTSGGNEGFVLTRYLMDEPSAREQLKTAQQQAAQQPPQDETANLKQQLTELNTEQRRLTEEYQKLRRTNQRLNQDLAQIRRTTANALAIDERNKTLEKQLIELERSLQFVRQENQALTDNTNQTWFLYGAGVVLAGVLIGLILPKLRLRKSSRWGEL